MHTIVRILVAILVPPTRDERGLSQSTENALLVAGAVLVAGVVVSVVAAFVNGKLQGLQ